MPNNMLLSASTFVLGPFRGLREKIAMAMFLAERKRTPQEALRWLILIHDFNGHFSEGLQKIVWDFCSRNGAVPVPMPDSGGSAVLVKPLDLADQAKSGQR